MTKYVLSMILLALGLNGCGNFKGYPPMNECQKAKIQIADMSHLYPECKGLDYEGKTHN